MIVQPTSYLSAIAEALNHALGRRLVCGTRICDSVDVDAHLHGMYVDLVSDQCAHKCVHTHAFVCLHIDIHAHTRMDTSYVSVVRMGRCHVAKYVSVDVGLEQVDLLACGRRRAPTH
jgi:hypothetical protein